MMLESILIENYKGFKKYKIDFLNQNILVGKNNAGKSTIGEVIRIVSLATNTYKNAIYVVRPDWLSNEPLVEKGYSPSIKRIKINLLNCIYQYEEKVATITAKFKGKIVIKIFINFDGNIFIKIFHNHNCIVTRYNATKVDIPVVKSLPSLRPLLIDEKVHDSQYVFSPYNEKNLSIHFRNRLFYEKNTEIFENFRQSISSTWPGIRLSDLYTEDDIIKLNVIDEDFATEISNFGDGLQIWLQILWFIASNSNNTIVFFDEPDVYLHAELQLKLFNYIKQKFNQFLIATHSIEIICSASNKSIIEIDKKKDNSKLILDNDSIQNLINKLGSYANIKVQRILDCKKLLFVEGDDIEYLKQIASRIFSKPYSSIDIPYEKSGGRSLIKEKILSLSADKEKLKSLGVNFYFLTDSDYFDEDENNELISIANNAKVNLHIWKRKEIENYFCDIELLHSVLKNEIKRNELEQLVYEITDGMKEEYIGKKTDLKVQKNRKLQPSTARSQVIDEMGNQWEDISYRLKVLSGKKIIKRIFDTLKSKYNISLSIDIIINKMEIKFLDNEIKDYIKKIYN